MLATKELLREILLCSAPQGWHAQLSLELVVSIAPNCQTIAELLVRSFVFRLPVTIAHQLKNLLSRKETSRGTADGCSGSLVRCQLAILKNVQSKVSKLMLSQLFLEYPCNSLDCAR